MSGTWVVRLPTWLGDTVMSVPVLRAVQRARGGALHLWGSKPFADLLAGFGLEFELLPYRRRPGLPGVSDAIRTTADLRHQRASTAILLPNAFEPALLTAIAGIPRRVGYATDGRAPLLTDPIPVPRAGERLHEADRFARLLEHVGVDAPLPEDRALQPTAELLGRSQRLIPEGGEIVGIVAGSANNPAKRWPAHHYAELAEQAERRWGARAALLGGAADVLVNETIRRSTDSDLLDFTGCTLEDLAAVLLRCRVVISNDTGAGHLAAALGRPTVVIFGPTDPRRSCPRGPLVEVVGADRFCQPCEAAHCPLDHSCMTGLEPTRVLDLVEPLWQAGA